MSTCAQFTQPQGCNSLLKLLFAKTNNSFNVGHKVKRYIFVLKTGGVSPKGIFSKNIFYTDQLISYVVKPNDSICFCK